MKRNGKAKKVKTGIILSKFLLKFHIDIRRKLFKEIIDEFGGNLRIIIYGSAPSNLDVIRFFRDIGIEMIQGYGLTEASPIVAVENDKYQRIGSVGQVNYYDDVKIINKDENGIGEIIVKGPNVMIGYYENPKLTKEVIKKGYLHTGDLGYLDKDGYLYITGRKKDMIVLSNGTKVFPQELESLINKSRYIEESFVYSIDQEKLSCKIVYSKRNEMLLNKSKEEIYEIIKNEIGKVNLLVPSYKVIKNISITTEPLAKTTTQKIKRYLEMKRLEK